MGCGSGALALPLARAGHDVVGLDFSAGMLDLLRRQAVEEGLGNVRTVQAAWDDDWRAAGVGVADVVIASRSLDVRDLRAALQKLDAFARRRVCVTLPADGLLYPQLLAHEAVGRPCVRRGDHATAVNVLRQMGIEPEVGSLEHVSASRYESPEAALESLHRMIAPAGEREEQALQRYVAGHVVETPGPAGRPEWRQAPDHRPLGLRRLGQGPRHGGYSVCVAERIVTITTTCIQPKVALRASKSGPAVADSAAPLMRKPESRHSRPI